jgi:hypothetical protein
MSNGKLLWLRFDFPYMAEAQQMRIAVCSGSEIDYLIATNLEAGKHIIADYLSKTSTVFSPETTLVCPQDDRHALAWSVKGFAEENQCRFARYVPADFDYPAEWFMTNEGFDTMSATDASDEEALFSLVRARNSEAHGLYQSATEFPKAIQLLREALQLCWQTHGWLHPAALYTLRNYCYIGSALETEDATVDVLRHLQRLRWWLKSTSEPLDTEAEEFLPQFAALARRLERPDLANEIHPPSADA